MSDDDKPKPGIITLNVGVELHNEIKAAANNEGESVTAFILGAIKSRLLPPAPKAVAQPEPVGKGKRPVIQEEVEEYTFDGFLEYLQQNYHNAFVREELLPVIEGFLAGKLLPSKDGKIK